MAQRSEKQSSLDPITSRLLDSSMGNTLRSGGRISGNDLSIADQQALGIRPEQGFKLSRKFLQELQDSAGVSPSAPPAINPNIKPIKNLRDVVAGNVKAPVETPIEQGTLASGGLGALIQELINQTRAPLRDIISASGPAGLIAQGIATPEAPIAVDNTTGKQELSFLDRLLNSEGRKQTFSDIGKAVKNVVPSETIEQRALKELSTKNPELAKRTDERGLKKFSGSGEFRVNGARYKIDNAGRIIKIG